MVFDTILIYPAETLRHKGLEDWVYSQLIRINAELGVNLFKVGFDHEFYKALEIGLRYPS